MSYSCNACGFYVQTGQSHDCYTSSDQTTVSQAYIDSLKKEIEILNTKLERAEEANKELTEISNLWAARAMEGARNVRE